MREGFISPSNVSSIKLSSRKALELLAAAAEDSSLLVNTVKYEKEEMWFQMTAMRQILLCFRDGLVVSDPTIDEHGNWNCCVHRVCGGVDVYVTVAIENGSSGPHKVYVLSVENRS